jgi:glycosyltransferase involved in cell wall biosynthesis
VFRKIFGLAGLLSFFPTLKLINQMKKDKCNLIHLHVIHSDYINYPLLFNFIKKANIPVVWTFHDCWSFTGRCPYFDLAQCEKWKTGCFNCPYPKNLYPESRLDATAYMWKKKKKWFSSINHCTIVTPSQWLATLTELSFLKKYPIAVINNGIDLDVFKPADDVETIKESLGLKGKNMVLGVAFGWGYRKGLDVFVELSKRLPKEFQIVLVGTDSVVDGVLPQNIVSIHRTHDRQELAKIYSAADVFVNPTREENYPTVNMESIACGTPVVTFNTGGCAEIVDSDTGVVVPCNDIDAMEKEIYRVCANDANEWKVKCRTHAKKFDMYNRFEEYVDLYDSILELRSV